MKIVSYLTPVLGISALCTASARADDYSGTCAKLCAAMGVTEFACIALTVMCKWDVENDTCGPGGSTENTLDDGSVGLRGSASEPEGSPEEVPELWHEALENFEQVTGSSPCMFGEDEDMCGSLGFFNCKWCDVYPKSVCAYLECPPPTVAPLPEVSSIA